MKLELQSALDFAAATLEQDEHKVLRMQLARTNKILADLGDSAENGNSDKAGPQLANN